MQPVNEDIIAIRKAYKKVKETKELNCTCNSHTIQVQGCSCGAKEKHYAAIAKLDKLLKEI